VREHANHPRLAEQGDWRACKRVETGLVHKQVIAMEHQQAPLSAWLTSLHGIASRWRRIKLAPDMPTEDGDPTLWLRSNLPEAVTARRIAELYRTRPRRNRTPARKSQGNTLKGVALKARPNVTTPCRMPDRWAYAINGPYK
jgi:hypothetical protein